MRTVTKDTITQSFLDYVADDTDPRLKFVLEKLAHHMHDFVRETNLTHDEWRKGLEILYGSGEISSPERNEFVLLSDVLGISSLVDMVNSSPDGTPSSVLRTISMYWALLMFRSVLIWSVKIPVKLQSLEAASSRLMASRSKARKLKSGKRLRTVCIRDKMKHSQNTIFELIWSPIKTDGICFQQFDPHLIRCQKTGRWANCCVQLAAILGVPHIYTSSSARRDCDRW